MKKGSAEILTATKQDISWMVDLSHSKRADYEQHQKQFWKMAENSDTIQARFFEEEIQKQNVIALRDFGRSGFVIGKIISPPEVYDAGATLMIDDFCVKSPNLWLSTGLELLNEITSRAKSKGAKQILLVCGNHDLEKSQLLEKAKLSVASKWYVGL
ncbi:MAG: hypothetical protein KGP29_04115 [Proteobacteria bacterium]|nr:hypothetical protein [Pseudomonadota bacterium]